MTLTVGSLFSGIGGLDLGLERAGMEVRWQVEIDDYCRRVLAKHWPDVPRYGDIKELDPRDLEPVDLICGGFPCQDVSSLGPKLGLEGAKSSLWLQMVRIVRHLRPRYVVVENVPDLLARGMDRVLGDLASLGFDAEWTCVPASAFGAPLTGSGRARLFIVAYADSGGRQGAWLPRQADGQLVAGATGGDRSFAWLPGAASDHWSGEPDVGRVAHGVPARVDRLRGLGNAVVPQVAEYVGRRIVAFDQARAA